jgi:hypothetical protein
MLNLSEKSKGRVDGLLSFRFAKEKQKPSLLREAEFEQPVEKGSAFPFRSASYHLSEH